jgi:hypothetical protein
VTAPATTSAKNAVIKLDNSAGALQTLTTSIKTASHGITKETDDDTTLGQRYESHTRGLTDNGSFSLESVYNTTVFRHMAAIWGSSSTQTAELNPAGTGAGRRKETAETVITKFELSWDNGTTTKVATEHKVSGDVTYADN